MASMEQNDVVLNGRRIKGVVAMMLAEISEHEDTSKNRETWRKAKRGLDDKNLTSEQARLLVNHAYFSLGVPNHRERCWELMKEAETLPFDQISHYISQYNDQDRPTLKKPKIRYEENTSYHSRYSKRRSRSREIVTAEKEEAV